MAMIESACGCRKGLNSQPCSTQFPADHLMSVRSSCSELSCSELDMVVMGQLMAGMDDTSMTNPHSRNREKTRQRVVYSFYHQGKQVCENMFRFLHTISETRYKYLKKSVLTHRLATWSHSNLKFSPAHALSLSSTEFVVGFIMYYVEQNALLLPGRVSGYSPIDIKLLPSSVSKNITPSEFVKSCLLNKDGCFHKEDQYVFYLLWWKEMR